MNSSNKQPLEAVDAASIQTSKGLTSDQKNAWLFEAGVRSANEGIVVTKIARQSDEQKNVQSNDLGVEPMILFANRAFCELSGYQEDELIGQSIRMLEAPKLPDTIQLDIERLAREMRVMERAHKNGESCTVDIRYYRKDGQGFWCELKLSPIDSAGREGDPECDYFIYHLRDVSKRIADKQKLQDQYKRLELAQEEMRQLAITDGLTRVYNRRFFDQQYELYWNTAMRSKMQLGIFLLDIDAFKKFNDRYGHQRGDTTLVDVASAIQSKLRRATDLLARYGGEEFVILVQDINQEEAAKLARYILESVRDLKIPHADSPTGHVTASLGFVVFKPSREIHPGRMLSEADQALYAAKNAGRDAAIEAEPLVFPLRPAPSS